MIKLVRNTWADLGLKDGEGNEIKWQYIKDLEELQAKEGLNLANKLKKRHIYWKNEKMKVSLATQVLSSSVANALEYCENTLRLPQFQGCSATVKFLRVFDQLFDILNSRHPLAKEAKSPLREENKSDWQPFLNEAKIYISGLTNLEGKSCLTN